MKSDKRNLPAYLLMTAACLWSAGCASSHPVHYYTLASAEPHAGPSVADGPVILVANIAASIALQDFRIRYRMGPNEEGAYEYYHWSEEPGIMVRNALIQALRASGKYKRVLESSSSGVGDYLVRGRLYAFDEQDSPTMQTKISVQVELIDKKTSRVVWDHLFEHDEPAGKSMDEVVASMDRNLGQVAGQAAAGVGQFLAGAK